MARLQSPAPEHHTGGSARRHHARATPPGLDAAPPARHPRRSDGRDTGPPGERGKQRGGRDNAKCSLTRQRLHCTHTAGDWEDAASTQSHSCQNPLNATLVAPETADARRVVSSRSCVDTARSQLCCARIQEMNFKFSSTHHLTPGAGDVAMTHSPYLRAAFAVFGARPRPRTSSVPLVMLSALSWRERAGAVAGDDSPE